MSRADPKILFCGDTHGEHGHIGRAVAGYERLHGRVDAIVHLGDFDLAEPLNHVIPKEVHSRFWWIPGNHDFDSEQKRDSLFQSSLAEHSLHLKVIEIAGLRVAGLGGIFKGKIWRPPDEPVHRSPRKFKAWLRVAKPTAKPEPLYAQQAIYPDEVDTLARLCADVLVTHEAPSSHAYGFDLIDQLAARMGVKLIVHGHHHRDYRAAVNSGQTEVIGVGLRGIADLKGQIILNGQ